MGFLDKINYTMIVNSVKIKLTMITVGVKNGFP